MNLCQSSIEDIREAVLSKKVSAKEVTRFFLDRITALDGKLNSFISINPLAEVEANEIDQRIADNKNVGILAGVPVAIKDNLCTKGLKTTAGSKMLANFVPPYSATVVERLKAAGAIVLGKTNLDEFAMGSSNETSAFGAVRNPWNTDCVPGGSSGGSAAAVAARLVPGAIGTDTGGSIRQPASFCGIYGLKPTYGRVSRNGIIAYASSLDQAGPMARSPQDCALLLQAISGGCRFDSTSAQTAVPSWRGQMKNNLKSLRVGLPREYFNEKSAGKIEADVMSRTQAVIDTLVAGGAKLVDVSLPLLKHSVSVYYLIATSEASSNLARFDGIRFGHRSAKPPSESLEEFYCQNRSEGFGTEVKRRIMLGTYALSSGYYDAFYLKACRVRRLLRAEFLKAFDNCDVILSPVTTSPAFKIGEKISDPMEMYLNDIFTTAANLSGLPGISVPAGFSSAGLPIGVQLTANFFDEQCLFDVCSALEEGLEIDERAPRVC